MLDLALNGIDLGRGRGGNETYLAGLIDGLGRESRVGQVHVLIGDHYQPPSLHNNTIYVNIGPYRRLPYLLWSQSRTLSQLTYDWFLSTYFLPAKAPTRSAVFVHDVSFRSLPKTFPLSIRWYMRILVSWAIGRSRKVIVLSQHIREEVRRFYPRLDPSRIIVLHPGCGDEYRSEPEPGDRDVLARHGLTPGYVLSVSSIHPRKNIAGLLRAYAWARGQGTLLPQLVLVGQKYWGASGTAGDAAEFNTRWLGFVPHSDLPAIYRGARLFAYPSLYEGFGLPPLEAMASGVPVVCGDNSSLPEAVGDAGLLVDVSRPEPLGDALMRLYGDEDLRRELIERGIARANRFRWRDTARGLVNALLAEPDTPVKPQNTKDDT